MALVTQSGPVSQSTSVKLDVYLTNNDSGAIYNSGSLDLKLDALAQSIADINPTYTKEQVLSGISASIMPSPTGEVYNGWVGNESINSDGIISLTHSGRYDEWLSTSQNPNWDTMALTISIATQFLDTDGIAGYNPATDARIELGTKTIDNAFIGKMNDFNQYGAPAQQYIVVPEPTSLALMATMGAVVMGKKLSGLAHTVKDYCAK